MIDMGVTGPCYLASVLAHRSYVGFLRNALLLEQSLLKHLPRLLVANCPDPVVASEMVNYLNATVSLLENSADLDAPLSQASSATRKRPAESLSFESPPTKLGRSNTNQGFVVAENDTDCFFD